MRSASCPRWMVTSCTQAMAAGVGTALTWKPVVQQHRPRPVCVPQTGQHGRQVRRLRPDGAAGSRWHHLAELLQLPAGTAGTAFAAVQQGHLICRVSGAIVPDGPAQLAAARVWLAVRRATPLPAVGVPVEHGNFLLRIALHHLEPAKHIKAVVDGVTAAMQRDEPGRVTEAVARLAKLLNADADELLRHATAASAPLGVRSRSRPASRESLFTLHGPAQVRVTPDDDRCIAAQVTTAGDDGPARLSVEVYSATHRPA
jgi:hypothetical protein